MSRKGKRTAGCRGCCPTPRRCKAGSWRCSQPDKPPSPDTTFKSRIYNYKKSASSFHHLAIPVEWKKLGCPLRIWVVTIVTRPIGKPRLAEPRIQTPSLGHFSKKLPRKLPLFGFNWVRLDFNILNINCNFDKFIFWKTTTSGS